MACYSFAAKTVHYLIKLLMSTSCRRAVPVLGPPAAGTVRLCRSSSRTLAGSDVGAWHVKFWHTKAAGLQSYEIASFMQMYRHVIAPYCTSRPTPGWGCSWLGIECRLHAGCMCRVYQHLGHHTACTGNIAHLSCSFSAAPLTIEYASGLCCCQ